MPETNTHLVDVDGVALLPLALALLLVPLSDGLGGFTRLDSSLGRGLGRHGGEFEGLDLKRARRLNQKVGQLL